MTLRSTNRLFAYSMAWLLLVGPMSALAETSKDETTKDLYRWIAPTAKQQLEADPSEIPAGQGAIFAPAMTQGADEPEVMVFQGEQRLASGPTGKRIMVAPGTYRVHVGSGATHQMVASDVTVRKGETTTVPANWGGLRIEVVDEGNIPNRNTYELIRMQDREVLGTGYGADTLQSETLQTWLLEPGLYRIVRTGETYRARSNFATVDISAGGLVHFKLVIDSKTSDFRGAGVVDADEFVVTAATGGEKRWTSRALLGGAVSINTTDNVVGQPNQDVLSGTVFFDTYVNYQNGPHFGTGIFEIEEGVVRVDPAQGKSLPTQKAQDRLRADVVYSFFKNERIGPYARFGLITNIFPSDVLVTEDTTIAFNRLNGARDEVFVPANGEYRTADSLGSLRIREGAGLNVRLVRNRRATANWRFGVGLRQNLLDDSFVEIDDPTTPELDLFELDGFSEEGIETTLTASVRLGRSLLYITDLEVFGDFSEVDEPTIDWRNTLSYRLTRFASLDYTLDLLRFPQVLDENQITQNILLRFSFNIL